MERVKVAEAAEHLSELVHRVCQDSVTVELEDDNTVVARIVPVTTKSSLTIGELNGFLQSLPDLGDDAEGFKLDVCGIRQCFPEESDPWD
jgi:antitoxin (DNA-binding transcriptional repressor) of toxin-antitoxin stability system